MAHVSNQRESKDTNLGVVRIFGLCLGALLFFYSVLAFRQFFVRESLDATFIFLNSVRVLLGVGALVLLANPPWLAQWLERHVTAMARAFETAFDNAKDKLKLIVLVTMVSLLVELVMIRWLASVFPVFSLFKN